MAEELADAIVHASEIMQKKESGKGVASIILDGRSGRCRIETEGRPAVGRTNLSYTAALNYVLRRGYVTRERDLEEAFNSLSAGKKILVFSKKVPLIEDDAGTGAGVHVSTLTGEQASSAVFDVIRELEDVMDEGVGLDDICLHLSGLVAQNDTHDIIDNLVIEGRIYSTIDDEHFKTAPI